MAIYGTALLCICVIAGMIVGKFLGALLHLDPKVNVGGVGFAMLLLICLTDWLRRRGAMRPPTEAGILFWSSIYIPVVVAMAASQDVRSAVTGGPAAILAGVLSVLCCLALVPVISRMGRTDDSLD
ncbi:MAG: madL [Akkermansiaceae bacterium]|nr:madL [Akkermansiaceae bacterium]